MEYFYRTAFFLFFYCRTHVAIRCNYSSLIRSLVSFGSVFIQLSNASSSLHISQLRNMSSSGSAPLSSDPSLWIKFGESTLSTGSNAQRGNWELSNDSSKTTWINPQQLDMDYYNHLQKRHRISSSTIGLRRSAYHLGGYEAHRRTAGNLSTIQPVLIEDFPLYALKREELLQRCLDILAIETERNGGPSWEGNTKTAKAIRNKKDGGLRKGLQGLFGRIVWYELLDEVEEQGDVGGLDRDSIFPKRFKGDEAVFKEFLEGGRTEQQTRNIMNAIKMHMESACQELLHERRRTDMKMNAMANVVHMVNSPQNPKMKKLICGGKELEISHEHFLKLLRLYRLHTDNAATENDAVFVSG